MLNGSCSAENGTSKGRAGVEGLANRHCVTIHGAGRKERGKRNKLGSYEET